MRIPYWIRRLFKRKKTRRAPIHPLPHPIVHDPSQWAPPQHIRPLPDEEEIEEPAEMPERRPYVILAIVGLVISILIVLFIIFVRSSIPDDPEKPKRIVLEEKGEAIPRVAPASPFPRDTSFTVIARRKWTNPPIRLPVGLNIEWMPQGAVAYQLKAANDSVATFAAVATESKVIDWPLHRMQFRTLDADSVAIRITGTAQN